MLAIYRGSNASVILNLLNKLWKRDKNVWLVKHFISICNKFDKFSDTFYLSQDITGH